MGTYSKEPKIEKVEVHQIGRDLYQKYAAWPVDQVCLLWLMQRSPVQSAMSASTPPQELLALFLLVLDLCFTLGHPKNPILATLSPLSHPEGIKESKFGYGKLLQGERGTQAQHDDEDGVTKI